MPPEQATFPPTSAWTDHERMLVLYRIAGLMQKRAQAAIRSKDPVPLEPLALFDLGERIKLIISKDRGFLETYRALLLADVEDA